ncbi:unnamed protein product [Gadus morhua 'NCC']
MRLMETPSADKRCRGGGVRAAHGTGSYLFIYLDRILIVQSHHGGTWCQWTDDPHMNQRNSCPFADMQSVVFFDLETTGLDTKRCDIIQLAAISGDLTFNMYMMPQVAIDRGATAVTGFRVHNGKLFQNGRAMNTAILHEALASFLDFLWSLEQPVLLAAHNARRFDIPVLDKALFRCSLDEDFQQLGSRFLDTLPLNTWQCDIIQLAAISGVHTFNIYMMPQVAIDRGATAVNGFSVSDGALLLRGTAIPTATLTEALTSFLDFLRSLEQPVLLAAHNARRFDKPVLDRALLGCSLARQFQQLGSRFLDTLPLSRALHPGFDSHSLVNLSGYFLPRHYNAHDALEDVRALQELYNCWNPRQETLDQFVF